MEGALTSEGGPCSREFGTAGAAAKEGGGTGLFENRSRTAALIGLGCSYKVNKGKM